MMPSALLRRFPIFVLAAAAGLRGRRRLHRQRGYPAGMLVASVVALLVAVLTAVMLARRPGFAALVASTPAWPRAMFVVGALAGGRAAGLADAVHHRSHPHGVEAMAFGPSARRTRRVAYWVAGTTLLGAPDIYIESCSSLPEFDPKAIRTARKLGPLNVDNYEDPPPSCWRRGSSASRPRTSGAFAGPGSRSTRPVVAIAVLVARRLDEPLGTHSLWLTPFVVAGPAIIATFQAGNAQMPDDCPVRPGDVLPPIDGATPSAERSWPFVIAGKLYPGVFVLYLLLRRDWRPRAGPPSSAWPCSWYRSPTSGGSHTALSCTRSRR